MTFVRHEQILPVLLACLTLFDISVDGCMPVADSEGGGRDVRPPPPKIGKKKRKSVLISPFPNIWWLKMQNFLGSLRSPALFNIILNIALLKNLENNTCSYILSSFYMVATGEGNFDMKMQDFWTLKSLNCRSFPPPGNLGGPQTPRQISPPLTQKPGSAPACSLAAS